MQTEAAFLESSIKKFRFQKNLGDKTFAQLEDKDLFFKPSGRKQFDCDHSSAHGRQYAQPLDQLSHEDGEKPWRERDKEFEDVFETREEVMSAWDKGWDCVLQRAGRFNRR
jgi:hypothetical protein